RDMAKKEARALLHKTARAFAVLRARCLRGCVRQNGGSRLARIGERVRAIAAAGEKEGEVIVSKGHIRVVLADQPLTDRQRAFVEVLGLAVFALPPVDHTQVVESLRHTWMICAEFLLIDLQHTPVESRGIGILALLRVQERQAVEALSHGWMVRAKRFLA